MDGRANLDGRLGARALLLAERLDTRRFEAGQPLARAPLVVAAGGSGRAVLFRYGVAVLFGLTADEERAFVASLEPLLSEPFATREDETTAIVVDPGVEDVVGADGVIHLHDLSIERLQIMAESLAKSVLLGYYETQIAAAFDRIEPLARELERKGRSGASGKALLRQIGGGLLTLHRMVGRAEVSEKPDVLWEHPPLERLWLRLADEFELRERSISLDRKVDLVSRTAALLLDLDQKRRSLRVEWYIVGLIAFEILFGLYQFAS